MVMNEGTIVAICIICGLGGVMIGGVFGIWFTRKKILCNLKQLPGLFVHEWVATMGKHFGE